MRQIMGKRVMSRREFLGKGSVTAGLLVASSAALASCSSGASSGTAQASGGAPLADFKKAKINWRKAKGATLTVGFVAHPFQKALNALMPQFEALTGISVTQDVLPSTSYFSKIQVDLASKDGTPDVMMLTGPYFEWPQAAAGYLEPLDGYLNDPGHTDAAWFRQDDFIPADLDLHRWNLKPGPQNRGKGQLWALPVQEEAYLLAYRKDLFARRGLKPPETWEQLYEVARAVNGLDGATGITTRGYKEWDTVLTTYSNGLWSNGGVDFTAAMRPAMASAASVQWNRAWAETVRAAGPKDFAATTWFEAEQNFMSGSAAMYLDCDFFAAQYEDPSQSRVAGKVGYALSPAGSSGIVANMSGFGLGMN